MKTLMIAVSAAALALPIAATAQTAGAFSPVTVYGTLGYAGGSQQGIDLGAIQGRLGARFGSYVGVEGELSGGVKGDTVIVAGVPVDVKLRHQEAVYGVGFLPVSPKFDLFARVGYGNTDIKASAAGVSQAGSEHSWNYGAGGQYFLDNNNGFRADYTRESFQHGGGDADVWSIGYVRKF